MYIAYRPTGWAKNGTFVLNTLTLSNNNRVLADRTNGRAIGTVLRLSVCL